MKILKIVEEKPIENNFIVNSTLLHNEDSVEGLAFVTKVYITKTVMDKAVIMFTLKCQENLVINAKLYLTAETDSSIGDAASLIGKVVFIKGIYSYYDKQELIRLTEIQEFKGVLSEKDFFAENTDIHMYKHKLHAYIDRLAEIGVPNMQVFQSKDFTKTVINYLDLSYTGYIGDYLVILVKLLQDVLETKEKNYRMAYLIMGFMYCYCKTITIKQNHSSNFDKESLMMKEANELNILNTEENKSYFENLVTSFFSEDKPKTFLAKTVKDGMLYYKTLLQNRHRFNLEEYYY